MSEKSLSLHVPRPTEERELFIVGGSAQPCLNQPGGLEGNKESGSSTF